MAFFWPLAPGSPSHRGPLQVLPTSSSLLTKAFLSVAAALLIPRLTVAPSHRYQPLAVGAAVHAGCTRGARADMRMGQAGPCHFGQPPRSGQSVGESGQAVHSFGAALVEDPDRHQGHTGTRVVERKIEASAGQAAQGAALHVQLHGSGCKVSDGEALVGGHCGYLGRR